MPKKTRTRSKPNGHAEINDVEQADTAAQRPKRPEALCDRSVPGFHGTKALDRAFKSNLARFTNGVSPAGMTALYVDWLAHLALSPGKQLQLIEKVARKTARFALYAGHSLSRMRHPASSHCHWTDVSKVRPGNNGRTT